MKREMIILLHLLDLQWTLVLLEQPHILIQYHYLEYVGNESQKVQKLIEQVPTLFRTNTVRLCTTARK